MTALKFEVISVIFVLFWVIEIYAIDSTTQVPFVGLINKPNNNTAGKKSADIQLSEFYFFSKLNLKNWTFEKLQLYQFLDARRSQGHL